MKSRMSIVKLLCIISLVSFLIPVFFMCYVRSFSSWILIGDICSIIGCYLLRRGKIKAFGVSRAFVILSVYTIFNVFFAGLPFNFPALMILLSVEIIALPNILQYNANAALKILTLFSGAHVLFTIIIQIIPAQLTNNILRPLLGSGYSSNYDWRIVQGYNCGITTQPGENSLYILIFVIIMFSNYMVTDTKLYLYLMFVAYASMLTTGKRGTLVISVFILAFMYIRYKHKRKISRKGIVGGIISCIILFFAGVQIYKKTDIIGALYRKINTVEKIGDFSSGRIPMWKNAILIFEANPIVGRGYKYIYSTSGFDVHNVYLQYLAEGGIIGFLLLAIVLLLAFKRAKIYASNIRMSSCEALLDRKICWYCVFMLIYLVIYGVIGNPFIDYIPLELFVFSICLLSSSKE